MERVKAKGAGGSTNDRKDTACGQRIVGDRAGVPVPGRLYPITAAYGLNSDGFEFYLTVPSQQPGKQVFYLFYVLSRPQALARRMTEAKKLGDEKDECGLIYWVAHHFSSQIQTIKKGMPTARREEIRFRILDRWGLPIAPWVQNVLCASLCKGPDHGIAMKFGNYRIAYRPRVFRPRETHRPRQIDAKVPGADPTSVEEGGERLCQELRATMVEHTNENIKRLCGYTGVDLVWTTGPKSSMSLEAAYPFASQGGKLEYHASPKGHLVMTALNMVKRRYRMLGNWRSDGASVSCVDQFVCVASCHGIQDNATL
ncbi:hypothetical protein EDB81DRAFT_764631 [Dactylonectria macrodidyma]|uniref:Uncharacterized protein n=1 Tax=Dactylonectria macrodidyma TaxID=307937 RepID=A0A9P9DYP0_9HYPO|nr:hypothetical protein EDB81DRAFT_764631 [Dactylonectria macrodidyma]